MNIWFKITITGCTFPAIFINNKIIFFEILTKINKMEDELSFRSDIQEDWENREFVFKIVNIFQSLTNHLNRIGNFILNI